MDQGGSLRTDGIRLGQGRECHGQTHLLPGPSPEWMVQHTLTPGDLRDLQVEPVKSRVATEDYSVLMNISWILRADGKFVSKIRPKASTQAEMCELYDPLMPPLGMAQQNTYIRAPKATY